MSKICKDILNGKRSMNDNVLNRVAVLSLCKFMCVSSKYCKENLNIIFGLLDSHFDSVIKTNILISLGISKKTFNFLIKYSKITILIFLLKKGI